MKHRAFSVMAVAALALFAARSAHANCNSAGACETVINQGSGHAILASAGSGIGLYGTSISAPGVNGESTSGPGVTGGSQTSNGVEGWGSSASAGNGVAGYTLNASSSGVYGEEDSGKGGYGVAGRISPAGTGNAVYGDNNSPWGWAGYFNGAVWVSASFYVAGTAYNQSSSTFTVWSDARLKKNVRPLEGSLERLLQLRGVTYEWIDPAQHGNETEPQRGFIAQEVEKVVPEWVGVDSRGFKTLNTHGLDAMVVESLRTLKADNDTLRAQTVRLEDRIKALESGHATSNAGLGGTPQTLGLLAVVAGVVFMTRRKRTVV